jgi:hypothetical protein
MLDREAVVRLAAVLCCARLVACECPADGEGVTHTNSLFDESTQTFQPIAGPRFPPISIRQTRTFGAVGSCVGSLSADGFDGGEIVVAATNALTSMDSYGTIMRYTAEIFLDWLNSERRIELPDGTVLTGGLMVDGKRYSLRFAWTDDFQQPAEAAISLAHSIRHEEARFAWGGYGSAVSEAQAGQAELDDVRPIKSTPFWRRHPFLSDKTIVCQDRLGTHATEENLTTRRFCRCCSWRASPPSRRSTPAGTWCEKRHFLRHLYINAIILPRQARDKHGKS